MLAPLSIIDTLKALVKYHLYFPDWGMSQRGPVSGRTFELLLGGHTGAQPVRVSVQRLVIAGWTGRDAAAVERHIRELEALGVRRPSRTPIFYHVAVARLALGEVIEVVGDASSGEVEPVLLQWNRRTWVGVGSDHTDRKVESYGVAVSKQMCDKPLAPRFWAFDELEDHWDSLIVRSYVQEGGTTTLYQQGTLAEFLPPQTLISHLAGGRSMPEGTLMFCGTLSALGGVRSTGQFIFELEDPVLDRTIRHQYRAEILPIAD